MYISPLVLSKRKNSHKSSNFPHQVHFINLITVRVLLVIFPPVKIGSNINGVVLIENLDISGWFVTQDITILYKEKAF